MDAAATAANHVLADFYHIVVGEDVCGRNFRVLDRSVYVKLNFAANTSELLE